MIDAHHHIWRQADLPWLLGPEIPRIFGPYGAIKRDYLIDEFKASLAGTGIDFGPELFLEPAPLLGIFKCVLFGLVPGLEDIFEPSLQVGEEFGSSLKFARGLLLGLLPQGNFCASHLRTLWLT